MIKKYWKNMMILIINIITNLNNFYYAKINDKNNMSLKLNEIIIKNNKKEENRRKILTQNKMNLFYYLVHLLIYYFYLWSNLFLAASHL